MLTDWIATVKKESFMLEIIRKRSENKITNPVILIYNTSLLYAIIIYFWNISCINLYAHKQHKMLKTGEREQSLKLRA